MTAQENADREQKIRQVADKILQLAYDGLLINMRFLDVALSRLPVTCRAGMGAHVFDGAGLTCDPLLLICQTVSAHSFARSVLPRFSDRQDEAGILGYGNGYRRGGDNSGYRSAYDGS